MRVIRNVTYVRQQKSRAKWLTLTGFLLFASGFVFVGVLKNPVFSYITLIPAYILFIAGLQQLGKWSNTSRRPRGDMMLDEQLKHLTDKYTLIHYVKIGNTMVEHLLLHPGGGLVMVMRDVSGKIELRKRRFKRMANPFTRILGASGPPLGQPDHEMDQALTALDNFLKDNQQEIDTDGLVIFTAFDHELDEIDPEIDVIRAADLPDYVRVLETDASFRQQDRDQIANTLTAGDGYERPEPVRSRRPVVVKRRAT